MNGTALYFIVRGYQSFMSCAFSLHVVVSGVKKVHAVLRKRAFSIDFEVKLLEELPCS